MKNSFLISLVVGAFSWPVQAHSLSVLPAGLVHEFLHILPVVPIILLAVCLLRSCLLK